MRMLILINMDIMVMVLDFMHVHSFCSQMVAEVRTLGYLVDYSYSVHVDDKKIYILVLGEGPTQRLDDHTITAKAKSPINFVESVKKMLLSLNYNESNCFLFVNAVKMYQSK